MRSVKKAGHMKALDPMPGIGQGKSRVAVGVSTRICRIIGIQLLKEAA